MKYNIRPHNFPLEITDIHTKYDTIDIKKKKNEELYSFKGLSSVLQAKNKFLSKIPFAAYKIYNFGERGSGYYVKNEIQDFYKIRDECVRNEILWEDPEFLAKDESLFYSGSPKKRYEWKRPKEIVGNAQFFVDGVSRFDVQQGELGDCWLLAAVANLTLHRRLFSHVVPEDQSFTENYAGVFHFRFWQYGRWIDVVIDDRLPTFKGRLIYMRSTEKNEFWSALLEKAYAKLHGCYEALDSGTGGEAKEDLTGGLTEIYNLDTCPLSMFQIILKAYERFSLMSCSIIADPMVPLAETPEGLIKGHEYSITSVKFAEISLPGGEGHIPLLRVRNPWGNQAEWNGPFSDKSPEWRFIPDHVKETIGLTFDADGEFWMSFNDFCKHFDTLDITNLSPDSLSEEEINAGNKKRWEMSVFEGKWVRGITAGGCRNYLDTFSLNPQYRITLTDQDDDDEENKCTVIVALMQKYRRRNREEGNHFKIIGFCMYHLPDPDNVPKPLDTAFFARTPALPESHYFSNLRQVTRRFKLSPGTYCIVPSMFEPNEQGDFLLRVFSEHQNNMEQHDNNVSEMNLIEHHEIKFQYDGFGTFVDTSSDESDEVELEDETDDPTRQYFLKLAGDDLLIDWMELKQILDFAMRAEITEGFSKELCRSLIALMDFDYSGKLGLEDFKILWRNIRKWKRVFKLYDPDGTNQLQASDLRNALSSVGYIVNNNILTLLLYRYGTDDYFTFNDFIMCAVRTKMMIEYFTNRDLDDTNLATFTFEDWLLFSVYS